MQSESAGRGLRAVPFHVPGSEFLPQRGVSQIEERIVHPANAGEIELRVRSSVVDFSESPGARSRMLTGHCIKSNMDSGRALGKGFGR